MQNGGFENGLANWEGGGEIITAGANSGQKALRICQNGVAVRQTMPATAGKSYTLNGSIRLGGTGVPFDLSREMAGLHFVKIEAEGQRAVVKKLIISK